MEGLDKCDQFLSYYAMGRKSAKWWKKVFFRMLELCIVNSMCLYFRKNPEFAKKRQAHKRYRVMLLNQLVQPYLDYLETSLEGKELPKAVENPKSRRSVPSIVRLVGKHFPEKKDARRKCSICAYKKIPGTEKRKDTKTFDFCSKCQKYICNKCFKGFHTKAKV